MNPVSAWCGWLQHAVLQASWICFGMLMWHLQGLTKLGHLRHVCADQLHAAAVQTVRKIPWLMLSLVAKPGKVAAADHSSRSWASHLHTLHSSMHDDMCRRNSRTPHRCLGFTTVAWPDT
ncbi:hypothetical protein COO60DRAFT_1102021 [Scenedesmus sp. NREL 46B-D3]|nr:hypothetical protein COO60DRAFT_1102021 [Scenedesmus sp. NREL 46B-D3]